MDTFAIRELSLDESRENCRLESLVSGVTHTNNNILHSKKKRFAPFWPICLPLLVILSSAFTFVSLMKKFTARQNEHCCRVDSLLTCSIHVARAVWDPASSHWLQVSPTWSPMTPALQANQEGERRPQGLLCPSSPVKPSHHSHPLDLCYIKWITRDPGDAPE